MTSVSDLFCGMGGLSYGFSQEGFNVKGFDVNPYSKDIFSLNNLGDFELENLSNLTIDRKNGLISSLSSIELNLDSDVIIGGPPCKPWSTVNVTKRKEKHKDYSLVESFFRNIFANQPEAFLMENVIPLKNDEIYRRGILNLSRKYSISKSVIQYSNYGCASKRKRFFTVGFLNKDSRIFFEKLEDYVKKPSTVREAMFHIDKKYNRDENDHQWSNLRTIHKYKKYYKTNKFGWYQLKWDEPAPSFGNVMKTYTLHPEGKRVVSVREVMSIMGFPDNFRFPKDMGHTKKYQMVADVVSPIFSRICAFIIKEMI